MKWPTYESSIYKWDKDYIPPAKPKQAGCNSVSPRGYICTRINNHKDDHVAHGSDDRMLDRWKP